jgi:hypothetical protein
VRRVAHEAVRYAGGRQAYKLANSLLQIFDDQPILQRKPPESLSKPLTCFLLSILLSLFLLFSSHSDLRSRAKGVCRHIYHYPAVSVCDYKQSAPSAYYRPHARACTIKPIGLDDAAYPVDRYDIDYQLSHQLEKATSFLTLSYTPHDYFGSFYDILPVL